MTLDDVLLMWDEDSLIEDTQLGTASIHTAKLHSKYLKLLIDVKLRRAKISMEAGALRKDKMRYYRGEMTRHELAERGWEPWQYNKPLKAEMEDVLKGDADMSLLMTRIELLDTHIFAVESILQQIKQRDFQISNGIKWKMFQAGV